MRLHHALAIVAKEHIVDIDIRAYLQVNHRICLCRGQCGTVTSYIDRTANDSGLFLRTKQADRHLLSMGTEDVQGLNRLIARGKSKRGIATVLLFLCLYLLRIIIEVAVAGKVFQSSVVGIGIRAVATTIDVAGNGGIDTHGITTEDMSGNIVTTVDVGHLTTTYNDTCSKAGRELIA